MRTNRTLRSWLAALVAFAGSDKTRPGDAAPEPRTRRSWSDIARGPSIQSTEQLTRSELTTDHEYPERGMEEHGAGRLMVLARDGVTEPSLVWKDTVLVRTGLVIDIVRDITNPTMTRGAAR